VPGFDGSGYHARLAHAALVGAELAGEDHWALCRIPVYSALLAIFRYGEPLDERAKWPIERPPGVLFR
jgi:hypothetical protein